MQFTKKVCVAIGLIPISIGISWCLVAMIGSEGTGRLQSWFAEVFLHLEWVGLPYRFSWPFITMILLFVGMPYSSLILASRSLFASAAGRSWQSGITAGAGAVVLAAMATPIALVILRLILPCLPTSWGSLVVEGSGMVRALMIIVIGFVVVALPHALCAIALQEIMTWLRTHIATMKWHNTRPPTDRLMKS